MSDTTSKVQIKHAVTNGSAFWNIHILLSEIQKDEKTKDTIVNFINFTVPKNARRDTHKTREPFFSTGRKCNFLNFFEVPVPKMQLQARKTLEAEKISE